MKQYSVKFEEKPNYTCSVEGALLWPFHLQNVEKGLRRLIMHHSELFVCLPLSLIVSWSTQPRGAREAPGSSKRISVESGKANPRWMSLFTISSSAFWCFSADLWFPREAWYSKSIFRSWFEIGFKGKDAPFSSISLDAGQFGCLKGKGSRSEGSQPLSQRKPWNSAGLGWPL